MSTIRWLLAWFHLLALAVGFGAVFARRKALLELRNGGRIGMVFFADNFWGAAAGVWVVTGLARAFGPIEKGAEYYFGQPLFLAKMVLFVAILVLEIGPMVGLIRWRIQVARGEPVDTSPALRWGRISMIQTMMLVAMVGLATAVARGLRP